MENTLSDKDKHGWGRNQDKISLPGPFARPKDHVWEGKDLGQKQLAKPAPIPHETRYLRINKIYRTMVHVTCFSVLMRVRGGLERE